MDSFSEIFEAVIQSHSQSPRNFGELADATHLAEGVNPLTGDRLVIQCIIDEDDLISSIKFTCKASSLATASASILTGVLQGKTRSEALEMIHATIARMSGEEENPKDMEDGYTILLEISHFPHRLRCATFAWNTAAKALNTPR